MDRPDRGLFFDPGGEHMGWAAIGLDKTSPICVAMGRANWPREGVDYQKYRMRLTQYVREFVDGLILAYSPEIVVVETVPSRGSLGYMNSGQSYIANVVATTIHNVAMERNVPVEQIGARTWQAAIALRQSKSEKITKPKIRNGVFYHLPELRKSQAEFAKEWDRWDACGIGLYWYGAKTPLGVKLPRIS